MAKKSVGKNLEAALPSPNEDYEMDEHMRTLDRAAGILADPKKLAKVHKLAGRKHKALKGMIEPHLKKGPKQISSLSDLRKVATKVVNNEKDEE